MDCGRCGALNAPTDSTCGRCAAPLGPTCAGCDIALRPAARFCDACGAPVEAAADSDGAVRKTVTVLFCDLVGSTSFGEQVDVESAREVMTRYYAMAEDVVAAHRGTVAKYTGDGVMAVFGVPEVAEDDADRAVATGLELQSRFADIGRHVADVYGVHVGLRVGVNTGEVAVDASDADLVGDALNTAARIEAACRPGRVLVGEDTWRLTRSHVAYDALGAVAVKGKAAPVPTFEVVRDEGHPDDLATPFVGREGELHRLQAVLAEATAQREPRMASVIGAPGVGKTRLASELVRAAGDDAIAFALRCERSRIATFAPIADLVRAACGISADAEPAHARAALETLVGDAPDRERVVALLATFVGAGDSHSTDETFFGVRRLIEILGRRRPLVVVIDDVHWAEPLLIDLLDHLVDWVRDTPVTFLALARPEIRDIRPELAEPGGRVTEVVALGGLDPESTETLAAQLLGSPTIPAEFRARLPTSTEGNPLFVRELVRMLVDDGVVTRAGDEWEMAVDAEAVHVPPTIQSLLATRVERMPADERRVVELASVIGSEFSRGAVLALADADPATVDTALERLRRKEVVERTGTRWGDDPVYRFHHVLVRDAAYRRLLKRVRADHHLRVASWLEQAATDLAGEFEPAIGFHLEQCFAYRTELGVVDGETRRVGRRAARHLAAGARKALERDDLTAASGLAGRALACLGSDEPGRPDLLLLTCEALLGGGQVDAAHSVLEELATLSDDPRLEAWATCYQGQLIALSRPEELRAADASLAGAAERLATMGDHAGVAKAHQVRAGVLARLGRIGDCEAELDLALTAAREVDDRRRVTAVLGSAPGAALWGPSPVPRAGGRCLDVVRLLRITAGSPAVEATSVRCQAVLEALRGRFEQARSMLQSSRDTAQELGLRHGLMETELFAGIVELLAGDPAAAEPHLRTAHGGLGRLGIGADAGQAAAHLARALLLQGRLDEAADLAAESDAVAGQNPQTRVAAASVEAEVLSARGRHAEAVVRAEEAVAFASGRDIVVDHASAHLALARVREAAGDAAGAEAAFREACRLFDIKGVSPEVLPGNAGTAGVVAGRYPPAPAAPLVNTATRVSDRVSHISRLGDLAELDDVISADAVVADHAMLGMGVGGRSDFVAAMRSWRRVFGGQPDLGRAIAIRGDDLALMEYRFGAEGNWSIDRLGVVETDDAGRLSYLNFYDPEHRGQALRELDDRSEVSGAGMG